MAPEPSLAAAADVGLGALASQPLTRDTIVDSDPPRHLDDAISEGSVRSASPRSAPPLSVRESPGARRSERPVRLSDSPELLVEEFDDEELSDEVAGLWHEEDSTEVALPADQPSAFVHDPRGEGPPSSSEERIVIPAEVSAPPHVDESASVIVNMGADVEQLVMTLLEADSSDWSAVDAAHSAGVTILPVLVREFPGRLFFDPNDTETPWPIGRDVSAVARAMVSFRELAVPYVVSLFDQDAVTTRFCAVLVAFDVPDAAFVEPVGKQALDDDERIRKISLRWLREHERFADPISRLLERFRSVAKATKEDSELRTRAIEGLGYLRDMAALRPLIALLAEENELVRQAARTSLSKITAQDFGVSRSVWDQWADQNLGRHRIEWLIDSLDHNDARLRKEAGDELQRLTHQYLGYHPRLSKKERAVAQRKYRDWWESEGRYEVG